MSVLGNHWPAHPDSPEAAEIKLTDAEMLHRNVARLQRDGMRRIEALMYQRAVNIPTMMRRAKIDRDTLWSIMRGETVATEEQAERMAKVLRVDIEMLDAG